jgi:hypothetical protein
LKACLITGATHKTRASPLKRIITILTKLGLYPDLAFRQLSGFFTPSRYKVSADSLSGYNSLILRLNKTTEFGGITFA